MIKKCLCCAIILVALVFGVLMVCALAEEEGNYTQPQVKVGPGLEVIKVGNINIVAPKGSRISQKDGQINVEDISAYVSRKLEEVDARFSSIENKQEEMKEDITQLKETVDNLQNNTSASDKKE